MQLSNNLSTFSSVSMAFEKISKKQQNRRLKMIINNEQKKQQQQNKQQQRIFMFKIIKFMRSPVVI